MKPRTIRATLDTLIATEEKAGVPFEQSEAKLRQLRGPRLPDAFAHIALWWQEVAAARGSNGMALDTVKHRDVQAWAELSGRASIAWWEVDAILRGDRAFVGTAGGGSYDIDAVLAALDDEGNIIPEAFDESGAIGAL